MITVDSIKELASEFKFIALKENEVTTYYLVRKSDNKVMYKTKCPVSIAVLFADFETRWERPDDKKITGPSSMDPDDEFLSLDVRKSMKNFNKESFLCLFGNGNLRSKPYYSNGIWVGRNELEFRALQLGIADWQNFIQKLCESETMRDIVHKILVYYKEYSW